METNNYYLYCNFLFLSRGSLDSGELRVFLGASVFLCAFTAPRATFLIFNRE